MAHLQGVVDQVTEAMEQLSLVSAERNQDSAHDMLENHSQFFADLAG